MTSLAEATNRQFQTAVTMVSVISSSLLSSTLVSPLLSLSLTSDFDPAEKHRACLPSLCHLVNIDNSP